MSEEEAKKVSQIWLDRRHLLTLRGQFSSHHISCVQQGECGSISLWIWLHTRREAATQIGLVRFGTQRRSPSEGAGFSTLFPGRALLGRRGHQRIGKHCWNFATSALCVIKFGFYGLLFGVATWLIDFYFLSRAETFVSSHATTCVTWWCSDGADNFTASRFRVTCKIAPREFGTTAW